MNRRDALAYIKAIKDVSREKYSEFVQVQNDFNDGRIDAGGMKAKVNELFKDGDHKHLILGFNKFMPTEYQIVLPRILNDQLRQDALAFVIQVKVVFKDSKKKYIEFLQVLRAYNEKKTNIYSLIKKGMKVFKGHPRLLLGFSNYLPDGYKLGLPLDWDHQQGNQLAIEDDFHHDQVKLVFQNNMEKYFEFLQVIADHKAQGIDIRGVAAIVKELFKGHTNLILGFNVFLPKKYQITLSVQFYETGNKARKVAKICQLPWDVLNIISKTLDSNDLFQFACVCKNWRGFHKMYWRNFLAFQEPLLVQKSSHIRKSFSFISIPNQKVYHSKMINYFWHFAYSGSSSGYLIMIGNNNSFLLMNPFTRRKMVINTSIFKVNFFYFAYHVLLAFGKGSKEFVLLALCKSSKALHIYQSRNLGWVTYSTMEYQWMIVDFVVLHNTIYVVTDNANIGVLNLNSININFLKMKSTPSVTSSSHLRLVRCDDRQLFVVHTRPNVVFDVYKIDFSTMSYIKLETLDNIALFYAPGGSYYALSNPNIWGYESNAVYAINYSSTKCRAYLGNDNKLPKYIRDDDARQYPHIERPYLLDWWFRHLHYEIDYSPVE